MLYARAINETFLNRHKDAIYMRARACVFVRQNRSRNFDVARQRQMTYTREVKFPFPYNIVYTSVAPPSCVTEKTYLLLKRSIDSFLSRSRLRANIYLPHIENRF